MNVSIQEDDAEERRLLDEAIGLPAYGSVQFYDSAAHSFVLKDPGAMRAKWILRELLTGLEHLFRCSWRRSRVSTWSAPIHEDCEWERADQSPDEIAYCARCHWVAVL